MVRSLVLRQTLYRASPCTLSTICRRHKSIRAAIERGVSQSQTFQPGSRRDDDRRNPRTRLSSHDGREKKFGGYQLHGLRRSRQSSGQTDSSLRDHPTVEEGERSTSYSWDSTYRHVPETLPYTTAASEFLYGYGVVLAALTIGRRKLYELYIHDRGMKNEGKDILLARARSAGVNVQVVGDEWLRVMDRASSGRPHNGFILEASPLPRPPITQLGIASRDAESFLVKLDRQSREDAMINGTREKYSYKSAGWRYPFLLYVDGVLDEGNLGAIARSAYFLGVDAIATPTRQIAPWSHIALKASAGAAEDIPIFTVAQPSTFLQHSALHGWRIYASDAISGVEPPPLFDSALSASKITELSTNILFTIARSTKRMANHYPVASHPTILMMGGEGSGLRGSLLNQAHYKVGIPAGRDGRLIGLDSLNVSVAASMLCYEFMRKPPPKDRKPGELLF